ncbi:MAG: sulfotransferase [Pseudomonadota bacterium]
MTPAAVQVALENIDTALKTRGFASAMAQMQDLQAAAAEEYSIQFAAAQLALRIEQPAWARETLQALAQLPPPTWQAGVAVVDMLRASALPAEARSLLSSLRAANPDEPLLTAREADLALAIGELAQARELYLKAQAAEPRLSSVYLFFSRDPEADPAHWLEVMAQDFGELTKVQHANLKVAQARCLDQLGRHDEAFTAFEQARELLRDPGQSRALTRQIEMAPDYVASFTPERMAELREREHASSAPIFVVGMPRSGSTLLAQVLDAHPEVHSVGERRILSNLVSARLAAAQVAGTADGSAPNTAVTTLDAFDLAPDTLQKTAEDYLRRAHELGVPESQRVVDKMPFNFSLVGPACALFPNGHVIHTQRDPQDTAWSMFTAAFSLPNLLLNLHDIGRLHALHDYLMGQWQERCGSSAIVPVRYEALTADFDVVARQLLESLGLEWSDDCARFFERRNEVLTSSDLQVRQPIHQGSVGRSAPYAERLQPFRDAYQQTLTQLSIQG